MCHMSRFTCHMSRVTCHVSHVTFFFFFCGEAYRWRICYQRDLPRLVLHSRMVCKDPKPKTIQNTKNHWNNENPKASRGRQILTIHSLTRSLQSTGNGFSAIAPPLDSWELRNSYGTFLIFPDLDWQSFTLFIEISCKTASFHLLFVLPDHILDFFYFLL